MPSRLCPRPLALTAAAAVLLATSGCRRSGPHAEARVVQVVPAGAEVAPRDLRSGIRVVFDRPLAVPGPLAGPGLVLTPAVPGESRWLDPRILAFFPTAPLRSSTTYTVALAPGLTILPRATLARWSGARFVHDRLRVRLALEGDRDFAPVSPTALLEASLPVHPADAARACTFQELAGGQPVRTVAAVAEALGERALRLRPRARLRPGTPHRLRCGDDLRPAEGGEGALAVEQPFSTHGPAAVVRLEPSGHELPADGVKVTIAFATPMSPDDVRQAVVLRAESGATVPMALAADRQRTRFTWSGDLEPGTGYEIVIPQGLHDGFGQPLGAERRGSFRVGDGSPRLSMDTGIFTVEKASGRYPLWTRNLPSFRVRCAAVPEGRLAAVLTGPGNYDAWWSNGELAGEMQDAQDVDYRGLGLRTRERTVASSGPRNRWRDGALDLAGVCGPPAAVYLLEVSTSQERDRSSGEVRPRQRRSLVNVTDLALLAKVGGASSLVWVVRLSTGKPVAGAAVKIRDLAGKVRFAGTTNADGVALAPGARRLSGLTAAAHDLDQETEEDYRARRVLVTAQDGEDLGVLDTNWNNGVQVWNFGVNEDRQGGEVRVRGFLHSDRGLYRPGDTVHLRGLVRVIDRAGRMAPPRPGKIHVEIRDPAGSLVREEELAASPFGGFHLDLAVDAEARLGDWMVRAEVAGQRFADRFSVEEYRPRTFEVKVTGPGPGTRLGQPLRFALDGRYLYGSPLRAAKVTWSVRRREHLPAFADLGEYVFQDYAAQSDAGRFWARYEQRSFSEPVADGEATLDAEGRCQIIVRDDLKDAAAPQEYLLSATVTDASGQGVTAEQMVVAHRSELYLGLHPSEFVQAVDMPFGIQVVALDTEGHRRAARARLTITRRRYDCGQGGSSPWSCTRRDEDRPAVERTIEVPAAGSAAVARVVLAAPGEYVIRVAAPGQAAVAAEMVWVMGKGEAFWSGDEGDRMTVVASKTRYRPGETARLVPQAQLPGALALLTLERDGILSYSLRTMATTGEALEVAVEPRLAPNVYAGVVLARGRTGAGEKGRPRFKMGLVNLEVEASGKRLTLAVETERPSYRPGERVKMRVKVVGSDGAPARAEVAVAVADEGVLQIAGYRTPDPWPAFYASWGLGVETATTWNRMLRGRDPAAGDDDEEGGDAGGEQAGRVRSRFVATAFWAPALRTRADGTVEAELVAPDNLTAFRVMAVAADAGDRFGSGERRFSVSKPLQALPALPRFLVVGDEAQAAVVVQNNTRAAMTVVVAGAMNDERLPARTVELAAGGSRRVAFAVRAKQPGPGRFRFDVRGGGERDAVAVELPVRRPSVPETVMVGEGSAAGRVERPLPPLGEVVGGSFSLTIDRTGLARLDGGLAYLVGYPYGCLEQTTSRVVPMIALGELARSVRLAGVDLADARRFVTTGVAKILRHQHDDGGFGLWIGAPPELHYTAYGLWGLELARAAGYPVDAGALTLGARYLRAHLAEPASGHDATALAGEASSRAFAHYVLAVLGQADPGGLAQLYERRTELPVFGRAFLARALQRAGRQELARGVARELAALVPGGNGPAVVREGGADLDWYWSSDVRTTALVLLALLETTPDEPAIRRLGEGLLAARTDGRWQNTQESVYSLLALSALARARAAGAVSITVAVGGQVRLRQTLEGAAVARLSFPVAELGAGPLVIESGGEVFYAARLDLERPLGQGALERGLAVERQYLDPDSGQPLTRVRLGQTIKVRLVVRAPSRHAHVAVVDHLPAGLEPVLTRFLRSTAAEQEGGALWWTARATTWQDQELRDDQARVFADVLFAGSSTHEYLARATTAGTFSAPPATVEAMYTPSVNGRSTSSTLVVEEP